MHKLTLSETVESEVKSLNNRLNGLIKHIPKGMTVVSLSESSPHTQELIKEIDATEALHDTFAKQSHPTQAEAQLLATRQACSQCPPCTRLRSSVLPLCTRRMGSHPASGGAKQLGVRMCPDHQHLQVAAADSKAVAHA